MTEYAEQVELGGFLAIYLRHRTEGDKDSEAEEFLCKWKTWKSQLKLDQTLPTFPFDQKDVDYLQSPLIDELFRIKGRKLDVAYFRLACAKGYFVLIRWLYNRYPDLLNHHNAFDLLHTSCRNGHYELVQWIYSKGLIVLTIIHKLQLLCGSALGGNLKLFQWMHELAYEIAQSKYVCTKRHIVRDLCMKGHLELLRWAHIQGYTQVLKPVQYQIVFTTACTWGRLEVAKWLLETFPNIDIRAFSHEALYASLLNEKSDVVDWLYSLYEKD